MVASITPRQAKNILTKSQDGVWFIRNVLGQQLWDVPEQIIRDLMVPRAQVAVKSCHASSKTFTAAQIALWFTSALRGQTIVTSPSWIQVEQQLWGEIRKSYQSALIPIGGEMLKTEWRMGPMNFALGQSTNDEIRFQGYHGNPILIIGDEAPGIRPGILNAIEGIRAGGDVRVLLLGNPNEELTPFRECFTTNAAIWKTYTIDGLHTPNMEGVTLDDLAAIPFDDDHKTGKHTILDGGHPFFRRHLISRRYIWEKYHLWGVNSPLWKAKVRGEFPDAGIDTLVPLSWADAARAPQPEPDAPIDVGIDVAGPGEDETVLQAREGTNVLPVLAWVDPDPRGAVVAQLAEYKRTGRLRRINVDAIGQGYYFARHIEDQGFTNVNYINVGERSRDPEKYANLKAEYYWNLRLAFEANEVHGLSDDLTLAQIVSLKYNHTPKGQIAIESKDKAKARGVKSPDRAEALMLAFAVGSTLRDGGSLMA